MDLELISRCASYLKPLERQIAPDRILQLSQPSSLCDNDDALMLNSSKITIINAKHEVVYRNAWAISQALEEHDVADMGAANRPPLKIKNENNNVPSRTTVIVSIITLPMSSSISPTSRLPSNYWLS